MRISACKNARGFTLIEMAVVIGVFAIILAALWALVGVMYEKAREHQANLQIQSIVRSMHQIYNRVGSIKNSSGAEMTSGTNYTVNFDQQGIFPVEMKINRGVVDGKVNTPWSTGSGGSVQVSSNLDANGEATILELQYQSLPQKGCIALAMQLSDGTLQGLNYMKIDGACYGNAVSGCSAGVTSAFPINLTTATAACKLKNDASGNGQNSVLFGLSIH